MLLKLCKVILICIGCIESVAKFSTGRGVLKFFLMASGVLYLSYLHHNSQSLLIISVHLDTSIRNTEHMIQITCYEIIGY